MGTEAGRVRPHRLGRGAPDARMTVLRRRIDTDTPPGAPAVAGAGRGTRPPTSRAGTTRLRVRTVGLFVLTLLAVVVFAIVVGSGELGGQRVLAEIVAQLTGGVSPLSEREAAIVWQLRAPRVLLAAVVGAALAGAGA
ncbi:iron chelate uptake ABC transporter family permease subunit, partial [Saccharomonospora halophila]|uniref:iron chelate uptake ABC transporter family permease subunit n=1 Tax=Saccharomonospora halophila TaxID=129922 RepID=UPI0038CD910A